MSNNQIIGFDIPHRVVSARRRDELREGIIQEHNRGDFSDLIYRSYTRIFECPVPADVINPSSLIIGAVAHPRSRIPFIWNERKFYLTIAPSYIRYWEITEEYEKKLNALLGPLGYWVRFARVPQKTLAVWSGLAAYGRNNITYVPGLGSFYMLVSYYSNMSTAGAEHEIWNGPVFMDRCRQCSACLKACPSGAIRQEAFPIHQDRCLTFYSGYSGPQDFPQWLDPAWVDGLVGCLRCQECCPENNPFRSFSNDEEGFSAEETEALCRGLTPSNIPRVISEKLDRLGLIGFFGESECLEMLAKRLALFIPRLEAGSIPWHPL